MPDALLQFDRHLFYLINHGLSNPFFDVVMPYLRNPKFWIPVYVFIFVFCLWRYKRTGLIILALLALTFGIADFGSAGVIKPIVKRLRPCNDPAITKTVVSRVDCGTGYSFPSSHASNHFAISIFLSFVFFRRWRWVWFWTILWAALVCFAQIYVGVHYPIDITCGALYGVLVGWLISLIFRKLQPDF